MQSKHKSRKSQHRPSLGLDSGMIEELLNFTIPIILSNPFFSKIISLNLLELDNLELIDNFGAVGELMIFFGWSNGFSGIEDGQHLGNLDCQVGRAIVTGALSQDGYEPQCSGVGVIDCIGECAGTEEEFKKFMDGITMWVEDKDLDKKFPELAKVRAKVRKEKLEKKLNFLTGVINGLLKCTWWSNFFQETRFVQSKERTRRNLHI